MADAPAQVIFSPDGALAGLQGTAAVCVSVQGLPLGDGVPGTGGHLSLAGLPFQGSVKISKKSLLADQLNHWRHILERIPFIDGLSN